MYVILLTWTCALHVWWILRWHLPVLKRTIALSKPYSVGSRARARSLSTVSWKTATSWRRVWPFRPAPRRAVRSSGGKYSPAPSTNSSRQLSSSSSSCGTIQHYPLHESIETALSDIAECLNTDKVTPSKLRTSHFSGYGFLASVSGLVGFAE